MKLNIVPARTGLLWVKQGMRAFFKQPIALSGLFFMFMAVISMCTILPWIGSVLALVLIPGATLGMMAASHEASRGRFPMPTILVTAFRAGHQQMRSMLVLGALYAAGFVGLLGLTALLDGGQFAQLYLVACWRNKGAFTLFGLAWMGVLTTGLLLASVVGGLLGPLIGSTLVMVAMLVLLAMFFASLVFTFRDCFALQAPVVDTSA